ncbi:hypothetical protein SAMN03080615_02253 [Amphritea atlantica]|uniref:DUF4350 domain-containing protein n=2 Tax=Amphritea atlantica TaxID=355243 RepID=A0A1H9HW07_9GAMM|nr:DUF4350 domain-containing protein [Amphritea atlantica]SEQ66432.1 hypothetical protein SAMN03080615_02253 [Amphritea atlantica]
MSNANRFFLWLLGGLLLLSVVWYTQWFFNNHERVTEEQRVDISPEAMRNRFLAAERFLQQLGYQAESFRARDLTTVLPPPGDVLLARRMPPQMNDQQIEVLDNWIEAGGILILTSEHFYQEDEDNDPFLAFLGVRMLPPESSDDQQADTSDQNEDSVKSDTSEADSSSYLTVSLSLASEPEPVTVSFLRDRILVDGDQWASLRAGSEQGANYLRFEYGQGRVMVLSDLDLFTNDRINKDDNAFLLSHLVAGGRKVWLQYSIDALPLPQLLWQKIPFIVCALVVLLLLMGWRLFLFTGPRLKLQNLQRRNLLEHIDATAHYAWRIDKGYTLFENNRRALELAWRKRHPALNPMDESQRAEWIGEKTGMAATAVERSLYHEITKDQDFIKATLVLQQLASGLKQRELR